MAVRDAFGQAEKAAPMLRIAGPDIQDQAIMLRAKRADAED